MVSCALVGIPFKTVLKYLVYGINGNTENLLPDLEIFLPVWNFLVQQIESSPY